MFAAAMRSWFARTPEVSANPVDAPGPSAANPQHPAAAVKQAPLNPWPPARLAVTDQLWGKGFTLPGGELETLQLARPLGLSSAASLLLIGVGAGGPASSIARNLGAWVSGLEVEPALVKEAQALMKAGRIANKAKIATWNPEDPHFAAGQHHHSLAIEPLRCGGQPEAIITSLAQTLKIGGQLVMTELVADAPLVGNDPVVARWARLERRDLTAIPTAYAVTRMMTRVGFDVRIVEDISRRHINNAMIGWRMAMRELEEHKPPPIMAAQLVAEAEIWLLRIRLLRQGRLQMMRWHAIVRASFGSGAAKPP